VHTPRSGCCLARIRAHPAYDGDSCAIAGREHA
jgi:hypothetical protein